VAAIDIEKTIEIFTNLRMPVKLPPEILQIKSNNAFQQHAYILSLIRILSAILSPVLKGF
jgi:hypothetical protein